MMHRWRWLAIGLLLVFPWAALSHEGLPVARETINREVSPLERLASGRWALAFVVLPRCPACERVIEWFKRAAEAFPEFRFLLVAPKPTPELEAAVGAKLAVLPDLEGRLGAQLGVRRAPTVFLSVDGVYVERLDWPFTEDLLLRKLAETLPVEFPSPHDLLGQPAPHFSTTDLGGEETTFDELPRPLLLAFFSLACPPCWKVLVALEELSPEVAVGIVAIVREAPTPADRERLKQFLDNVKKRGGSAVVLLDALVERKEFLILTAYKVGQSPTFILIDGKGVIAGVWEGQVKADTLAEEVRQALANAG